MIFRAKGALKPKDLILPSESVRQKRRKICTAQEDSDLEYGTLPSSTDNANNTHPESIGKSSVNSGTNAIVEEQATVTSVDIVTEGVAKVAITCEASQAEPETTQVTSEEMRYCPECYLPLHPDPNPEKLYIFLHAIRYTTSLGSFETEMPEWAAPDFHWER